MIESTAKPILYVKPGCPWCSEATTELDRQGIAYKLRNVATDAVAREEMQTLSGQSKVPVLNYFGDVLADFGADELVPFLAARVK